MLAAVPRPCRRALDVGCGLGGFARRLADVAEEVDAIDHDASVLIRARELSAGRRGLCFINADFMAWDTGNCYDLVSMIATLHHLPFDEGLGKAAGMLSPGGVLAVIGLSRARFIEQCARSAIAYPVSFYHRATRHTAPVGATLVEPSMTLGEIRRRASEVLPGVLIRRRVLWRYSLIWTKPATSPIEQARR